MLQKAEVKTKSLFIRGGIPVEVLRKSRSIAVLQGKTWSQYITEALINYNDKQKENEGSKKGDK